MGIGVISEKFIADNADFLAGGGEMGDRIAAFDWARTPMGAIEDWPPSVRTTVALILRSPVPIVTLWGEAGTMIYNDAYSIFAGRRHPQLLGSEVRKGWPEVAEFNDHVMKTVFGAGGTLSFKDQELTLYRSGLPEQVFMDLDYSPVIGEDGVPLGAIAIVVETSERHWAQRRNEAIARLGEQIQQLDEPADIALAGARLLGETFGVSRVGYGMIDRNYLTFTVMRDWTAPGVASIAGVIPFETYFRELAELRKGEPVAIGDVRHDPRTADIVHVLDDAKAIAFINIPVMERGEVVALLFVNSATPREWTSDEIALAQDVATRMRTAVERRRAEADLRQSESRLRFLDALNKETASSRDADEVMAITTRMTGEHLGVAICAYADMEADQDHFNIRGDWSAPGSASIVGRYRLADFGKLAVRLLRAGEPMIINDNTQELAPEEAATFQAIGIGSTICMPLVKGDRLTALMAIHHKGPHVWTDHEIATIGDVVERSWAHIERVRTQLALRASDAEFRTFAQAMPNHVWTSQPDGLLDWFNDQVYAFSGAQPGELDGAAWTSIVHPDDIAAAAASWSAALVSGDRYEVEFRLRRYDGAWRWHLARAVPIRDAGGAIRRWIGTNTDVDDRKNTETLLEQQVAERAAELRRSEEQFRLLVAGRHRLRHLHARPEGQRVELERRRRAHQGLRRADEIIGSTSRASTPPEDRAGGLPRHALGTAAARVASRTRAGACARTARRFWASVVIDAIRDDDGTSSASPRSPATSPSGATPSWRSSEAREAVAPVPEDGSHRAI